MFVGFGIRAPKANHDDFANVDVKGKIVLLLAGNPKDDPHSPLSDYADIRRKALTARELGAVAILVVLPKSTDAQPHSRFEFSDASDAGLPVLRVKQSLADTLLLAIDGKSTTDDWHKLADDDKLVSTDTKTHVRLAVDVKKIDKVTANVVGLIPGSDPTLKAEVVVIGAHLDHLGMGGPGSLAKSDAPAIHHGADDNASGAVHACPQSVVLAGGWFERSQPGTFWKARWSIKTVWVTARLSGRAMCSS